jgi:xylulokinase
MRRVVAPGGYLAGRLSGAVAAEAVCDRTQANLFGCFDVAANRWDADLAGRSGLPPSLLPRIADPFEVVGALSADAAARSGLSAGTPIAAGMGDGTGGWLAAGGIRPGICIDTSGSSAHFAVTVDRFVTDAGGLLSCMPSAAPGRFYLLGFTTGTGLAHRWMRDTFGRSYEELERLAAEAPPGSNGVLAVPHFNGRVSPFEASIKGAFIGFDDKTGPGDLYRALLEASAYELDGWLAAALKLAPDVTPTTVVNVGGGAQNALWNQIKADVSGLTLRTAQAEVNAARGAALAAAVAVGAVDLDAEDNRWFSPDYLGTRLFSPDAARHAAYAPYRDGYAALTEQLLPVYRTLQKLRQTTLSQRDKP